MYVLFVQPKKFAPTATDRLLTGIRYSDWDITTWIHRYGVTFFQDYVFAPLPAVPYTEVCAHDLLQRWHVIGSTLWYFCSMKSLSASLCDAHEIFITQIKNWQNKTFYTHWACCLQAVLLQKVFLSEAHTTSRHVKVSNGWNICQLLIPCA